MDQIHEQHQQPITATRVFDVSELLEAILLQLPIKHLLVSAQRVCKTWRDAITHSAKLQRALFFAPLPGGSLQYFGSEGSPRWIKHKTDLSPNKVFMNPYYWCIKNALHEARARRRKYGRGEASWRRMLVCQPPLCVYPRCGAHDQTRCLVFEGPETNDLYTLKPIQYEGGKLTTLTFGDIETEMHTVTHCNNYFVAGIGCWEPVEFGYQVSIVPQIESESAPPGLAHVTIYQG